MTVTSRQLIEQLPPPNIIPLDEAATLARIKNDYQGRTGHYPGTNDPETFQLEQIAYERELVADETNEQYRQGLLAFATGPNLDHLGALVETPRLEPAAAATDILFTFAVGAGAFVVAAGYQIMASDQQTIFTTTQALPIADGTTNASTTAIATVTGTAGNGFLPGEIATPVTSDARVVSVANTTTSSGGAEAEEDDPYRERIYLAPSQFSVAGPSDAYEYFARSASAAIKDVSVDSPAPNEIVITAVMAGGEQTTTAVNDAMLEAVNPRNRRPLGDLVSIGQSEPVEAQGEMTIQIYRGKQAQAESIEATARERINILLARWRERLGRDIVPEALTAVAQQLDGVYRATTTITYKQLSKIQFPRVTLTKINIELVDEDALEF